MPSQSRTPDYRFDRNDDLFIRQITNEPLARSEEPFHPLARAKSFLAFLLAVNHLIPEFLKITAATCVASAARCRDFVVEPRRIELLTCCVQSNRSPS